MRIASADQLLLGLGTGVAFGALLQRGRASRYDEIMAQLRLRDGTIGRLMGTAIAVGAVGVHALVRAGKAKLEIKPLQLGGIVGGGALFGTGLAVLGYCPGTTLAAIGEGRRDAIAGALGMLAGAGLFVRAYPTIEPLIKAGDRGKETLPGVGGSPWPWVVGFGALVAANALFRSPTMTRLLR
jgi:hypothetical protein